MLTLHLNTVTNISLTADNAGEVIRKGKRMGLIHKEKKQLYKRGHQRGNTQVGIGLKTLRTARKFLVGKPEVKATRWNGTPRDALRRMLLLSKENYKRKQEENAKNKRAGRKEKT